MLGKKGSQKGVEDGSRERGGEIQKEKQRFRVVRKK